MPISVKGREGVSGGESAFGNQCARRGECEIRVRQSGAFAARPKAMKVERAVLQVHRGVWHNKRPSRAAELHIRSSRFDFRIASNGRPDLFRCGKVISAFEKPRETEGLRQGARSVAWAASV